jgi:N-acyl-D-amino-acid deacylase
MRDEGYALVEAVQEVLDICRESGVALLISHFKAAYKENWGKVIHTLRMVDEARQDGLDVTFDQYPYIAGSTMLDTLLPPWAREGGTDSIISRLKDREARKKIKKEIIESVYGWENTAKGCGWNNIIVTSVVSPKNKRFEGKSLEDIAALQDKEPEDALFDLLIDEECAVTHAEFSMCEEDVKMVMQHKAHMFCSDGIFGAKPHPRVFGTFPRILGRYVREKRVLELEDAVRKMTSLPAQRLNLKKRGVLQEGNYADIVVFDAEKVIDKATYADSTQPPEGITHVFVNGVLAVRNGRRTEEFGGKVLRK